MKKTTKPNAKKPAQKKPTATQSTARKPAAKKSPSKPKRKAAGQGDLAQVVERDLLGILERVAESAERMARAAELMVAAAGQISAANGTQQEPASERTFDMVEQPGKVVGLIEDNEGEEE